MKAEAPKGAQPVDTGWRSMPPSNSTTTTTVIAPVPPLPRADEPETKKPAAPTVADDAVRRGGPSTVEPDDVEPTDTGTDTDDDDLVDLEDVEDLETGPSGAKQWAVLLGQGAVALVAGGLMFKGFEKLWDMLPMVALVLAVLVIVGLVAMVRILRRTDDITSLVIALVAGVFVTLGPLAFLLSTR